MQGLMGPQQSFTGRQAAMLIGLAVIYFALAKLGLALSVQAPQISAVWPATGLAIAAAYRFGTRALLAVLIGAFAANATADEPLWVAAGIATGNTLEAWLGGFLIRRIAAQGETNLVRRAVAVLIAALAAPIVSATPGVSFLVASGMQPAGQFVELWRVWWIGDALGALVLTPALAFWNEKKTAGRRRVLEFSVLLAGSAFMCGALFYQFATYPFTEYIVFPFVIWAAMRLNVSATAVIVAVCDTIAIAATYYGFGPFVGLGPERGLVHLQTFIAVAAATGLLLASVAAQRRDAEAALREADRRKDEFLATLAHELRNPLAAIGSAAQLLAAPGANADSISYAGDVIRRQVSHLARLLDDLLDVGRLITGKLLLDKEVTSLADVVESAVATVGAARGAGGHALEVDCESVFVHADRTRLEQIVMNLVSNALTYTPAGGRVQVTVRREQDEAVLTVRDNGIGLAPQDLAHVFDLFYQGKVEMREQRGLGIGLTLVQRLVELHDGIVGATSEGPGKGAQFSVRLPAVEATGFEIKVERTRQPSREVRSVLLIEDNDDVRLSLTKLLEAEGCTVDAAADGRSGLELALRLRPEIILIDIGLPLMDGYEVARTLRQRGYGNFLVALSGYGRPEDKQRALDAGFDAHLTKPADIEKLRALIRMAAAQA